MEIYTDNTETKMRIALYPHYTEEQVERIVRAINDREMSVQEFEKLIKEL